MHGRTSLWKNLIFFDGAMISICINKGCIWMCWHYMELLHDLKKCYRLLKHCKLFQNVVNCFEIYELSRIVRKWFGIVIGNSKLLQGYLELFQNCLEKIDRPGSFQLPEKNLVGLIHSGCICEKLVDLVHSNYLWKDW